MSRPIEQALHNLIPRHSGTLPPELIELASSLLSQSRMKVSTLKAEEEIGRTYACANIACERLKTTLNLPPIEPRPPVPPRIYKNLYNYLDRSLVSSTRRRQTPSKATPTRAAPQKQRGTPAKESSLTPFRSSRAGLKHSSTGEKNEKIPSWIASVVRKMCREMQSPNAIPHVLAGVETILTQPRPSGAAEKMVGKTPALLAAVWFFVLQELTGIELSGKEFAARNKKIMDLFGNLREDRTVLDKVGEGEEAWVGWEEVKKRDVQVWVEEILGNGWLEIDWYANIGSGDATDGNDEMEAVTVTQKRNGLGATMADQYDYLSEENRAEYARWKKLTLRKIEELIKEGVMEVDS